MSIYRGPGGSGDAVNDAASEATLVSQLVTQAQQSEANAAASATAAQTAENNAETAETNAETAETNAAASAASALSSKNAAATSATNAANSASAASTSATNAATSASNAASSATSASSSASTATTQATNASNSASAAATSATNAANSASAAATSATNAANSATSASGSATTATTQATNASNSATAAASSATSASGSASTATTQAGIATTQATNASNSASAAATSATNAATSETNAANSASAASTSATNASNSASSAATSATAAAASYDSFDDRYLGAKAVAPTVDNDGNTLLVGALYFNTVSNFMKVWDGSSWLDAYASLSGALLAANNLSELTNTATARTNLGVAIGTNVQAWDADLDTWATKTAPTGVVIGTTDSQTLTNKTIALGSNTVSGTLAQFNTAVTDADLVSLAGTETLTNKTLTSPVISGGTINNAVIGGTTPAAGTFTSITDSGNLTFTGTGNRITGDFSNATLANRVAFQTSTTNGNTGFTILPNGTATSARLQAYGASDPTNAVQAQLSVESNTEVSLRSAITGTASYAPLTMWTGGSERLRITTAGNIGIGTTSPTNYGAGYPNLTINGTTTGVLDIQANGTNQLELSTGTNYAQISAVGASGVLAFTTAGNTERMRIDASGNVGIGTSTPAGKLTIVSGTNNGLRITDGTVDGVVYSSSGPVMTVGTVSNHGLQFYTNNSAKAIVTAAGDFGIGTTNPSAQLEIYNASTSRIRLNSATNLADFALAGTTLYVSNNANGPMLLQTNNTERMRIDSSGNVGIGTSSPSSRLDVSGAVTMRAGGLEWNQVIASSGYGSGIQFARAGYNNWVIGSANNSTSFAIGESITSPSMTFASGGNVGIGTSSPTSIGAGYTHLELNGSTSGLLSISAGGVRGLSLAADGSVASIQARVSGQSLTFWTNNAGTIAERMRIDSSGNVGIGVTNPVVSLEVNGTIRSADGTAAAPSMQPGVDADTGFFRPLANNIGFSTAGTERMRIDSSGKVGIGVTPSAWQSTRNVLQVGNMAFDSLNASQAVIRANNYYDGTNDRYISTSEASAYQQLSGQHQWFTAASGTAGNVVTLAERMRIDSNGNLFFSTTAQLTPGGVGGRSNMLNPNNDGAWALALQNNASTNTWGRGIGIRNSTDWNNGSNEFIYCVGNTTARFFVQSNGGIYNYSANNVNLSDERTKKDIQLAGSYLDKICAIPVKTFLYKDQTDTDLNLGVIAQDVEAVAPEFVTDTKWGSGEDAIVYKTVYEADLMYGMLKAIQELKAELDATKAELNLLKGN